MKPAREVDNRCTDDVIVYYEARIEALVNRIKELEAQVKGEKDAKSN